MSYLYSIISLWVHEFPIPGTKWLFRCTIATKHTCALLTTHTLPVLCTGHRTDSNTWFFQISIRQIPELESSAELERKGRKTGSRHLYGKAPEELQIQTSSIFKSLSISIFTYWATPRNNPSCALTGSHMDHEVLHTNKSGTSVLAGMHHFGTTMMVKHVRRDMVETTNGVSRCLKPA